MTKDLKPEVNIIIEGGFMSKIEEHEFATASHVALYLKESVTFTNPTPQSGRKTPDIKIGTVFWEMKSPKGSSSRTIENNLRTALKQSPNIILDLHRIKIRLDECISDTTRHFNENRKIKRIIIITKSKEFIDLKR